MNVWIIGAGILFVALIVLTVALTNRNSAPPAVTQPDVPSEWAARNTLGNPEAVVTVEAWEDFLCPACGQWSTNIKPQLYEKYIKNGDVKLEFHHFPLQIHAPGAQLGAQAAECAADQDAFWPYHDQLFSAASNRGQAGFQIQSLAGYAKTLELDESDFLQCMNSQRHRATIDESVNRAISQGLNSTPSILINGQLQESPFDLPLLEAEIDRLLAAASSGS